MLTHRTARILTQLCIPLVDQLCLVSVGRGGRSDTKPIQLHEVSLESEHTAGAPAANPRVPAAPPAYSSTVPSYTKVFTSYTHFPPMSSWHQ